jgi:phytoene desaturase
MSGKKVIIIGAGVGGLTTAIHLARRGFSVEILEKNDFAGGRCSAIKKDGHHFDVGATLLMMTDVYKQVWKSFGRDLFRELDLIRMDPIYSIRFKDGEKIDFSSDLSKMQEQLEALEKGSFSSMLNYLDDSYRVYQLSMKHIIDRDFRNAFQFFNPKNLFLLLRLNAFKNHYKQASGYFKNELLRTTFTFQNIYVGQNPFDASAIFAMLPFLELTDGVWYPKGGMTRITDNLLDIARENGATIRLNTKVSRIMTNTNKTQGIEIESGEKLPADLVVCNGDLPSIYSQLLPDRKLAERISSKEHTCSAIIFHWGLDKEFPQFEQHNVYVSGNYRDNIKAVFEDKGIPEDTSFYVHSPARSEKSPAPDGQDSISLLVPVSHLNEHGSQDWLQVRNKAKKLALQRLSEEGITDLEKHIKFELVYNPGTWRNAFNVSKGSVFGSLSHKLMQMGYMRPHNQHSKYKNLFFVGGSTHPGNGIPMVLLSAKHTSNAIFQYTNTPEFIS